MVSSKTTNGASHPDIRCRIYVLAWIGGLAAIVGFALTACSESGKSYADDRTTARPRVVATTVILSEFAKHVAGADAIVTGIIPAGIDPHSFQPSTRIARDIAESDLLIVNGYNAEEGLLSIVLENRANNVPIVVAAAGLTVRDDKCAETSMRPVDASKLVAATGDPHLWMDVGNAIHYVENIRDGLILVDPEHRAGYESRAAAYVQRLRTLDSKVHEAVDRIPEQQRRLIIFHDAFCYFTATYGLELVASLLPSSAGQDPSASDVAAIVETVRETDVPAIYAEPQFDSGVLELVAKESGARMLTLYSDTFTATKHSAGTGPTVDSYEAMMLANVAALLDGLGRK